MPDQAKNRQRDCLWGWFLLASVASTVATILVFSLLTSVAHRYLGGPALDGGPPLPVMDVAASVFVHALALCSPIAFFVIVVSALLLIRWDQKKWRVRNSWMLVLGMVEGMVVIGGIARILAWGYEWGTMDYSFFGIGAAVGVTGVSVFLGVTRGAFGSVVHPKADRQVTTRSGPSA